MDAEVNDAGAVADASDGAAAHDGGEDASLDASAHDSGDGGKDGGAFACGPALTCDSATQYCDHSTISTIVVLIDGGTSSGTYSCETLPACDAASPCSCFPTVGSVLESCSCSDNGGDVTETCSCNACAASH